MNNPARQNVVAFVETAPHRGRRRGPTARRDSLTRGQGRPRPLSVVVHGSVEPTDEAVELLATMFEDWVAEGCHREEETDD